MVCVRVPHESKPGRRVSRVWEVPATTRYQDLGPDYYERQRDIRRQIAHHAGKLGALGFEVTLCRHPEPEPGTTGDTQAA
jgi:hypothetical protein